MSMRRQRCWLLRSRSCEISNTTVFEEPEDDILASKFDSAKICMCSVLSLDARQQGIYGSLNETAI